MGKKKEKGPFRDASCDKKRRGGKGLAAYFDISKKRERKKNPPEFYLVRKVKTKRRSVCHAHRRGKKEGHITI